MGRRLTLDLSEDTERKLEEITNQKGISKAEAMRRAFALLALAEDEDKKGNSLGIIDNETKQLICLLVGV
ncbi:MAG: ribbon-helix-helix protein, CopG family [Pseudomonadota bacterium]